MRHQFFAKFHSFIYGPVDFAWLTTSQVLLRVLQILRYVCVYKERRRSSQNFPCSSNRPQNRSSDYIFLGWNMSTLWQNSYFPLISKIGNQYKKCKQTAENVNKQLTLVMKCKQTTVHKIQTIS